MKTGGALKGKAVNYVVHVLDGIDLTLHENIFYNIKKWLHHLLNWVSKVYILLLSAQQTECKRVCSTTFHMLSVAFGHGAINDIFNTKNRVEINWTLSVNRKNEIKHFVLDFVILRQVK